jgi:NifU-like protein involved in Fe-S cluster formation
MKVSEYHKKGLNNFVDDMPEGFELLGSAKEGVHKIECYIKKEGDKIIDAKFNSSKRCKKLMAIADLVCEKLKGQNLNNITIDENEILEFFKEEKDKEKMKNRLGIVLKAINSDK